jgi:DNA-nicking Smr family endonuclease
MSVDDAKIFAAELRRDLVQLDLHGMYPENALQQLELFLYDQQGNDQEVVRVIYGGGKGILREKVLRYLQRHPMVDTLVEQGGSCIVFLSYN